MSDWPPKQISLQVNNAAHELHTNDGEPFEVVLRRKESEQKH